MCRVGMGGRGWSLTEKHKKTVVEAVDLIQPPDTSKQMAEGAIGELQAVSVSGAPLLWGLLTPLDQRFLFGMMWEAKG